MQYKLFIAVIALVYGTACSEIKEVAVSTDKTATNTNNINTAATSSLSQLQQIEAHTRKISELPAEARLDKATDLLSRMVSYEELYSRDVTWDTSWLVNQDWIAFTIKVNERVAGTIEKKTYSGFAHVSNPKHLFVQREQVDSVTVARKATPDAKETFSDKPPYRSIGSHTAKEWNDLLMREKLYFDGLYITGRNFNFTDLTRISLNNAYLFKDTLFKVKASSPSNVSQSANTYTDLFLNSSHLSRVDFRNWFFVAEDPLQTHWNETTIINSDLNDVSFKNLNMYKCTLNNVILRNTNGGGFENAQLSNMLFMNGQWEDIRFNASKFSDSKVNTPWILRGNFNKIQFLGSTVFSGNLVAGITFTACGFASTARFETVKLQDVSFTDCNLSNFNFTNQCDFTNVKIKGGQIGGAKFNNTILEKVTFGDPASPYPLNMAGTDLRNAVFSMSSVVFNRCDVTNALLPSASSLQANGVKFINCVGAPYNSIP